MTTCRYNHEKKHSKSYKTCNFTHHFLSNFLLVFNDEFALRFCYIYWNYSESSFGVSWKSSFISTLFTHFHLAERDEIKIVGNTDFFSSSQSQTDIAVDTKEKRNWQRRWIEKRRLWISHLFTSGRLGFWIEFW